MNTTFGFMDILIVFSGAYLVYAAVQMKRTGEITSSAMGVLVMLSGALDYMNDLYWNIPYFGIVMCGVFLVMIIIYCKISMDAQKKYLSPK